MSALDLAKPLIESFEGLKLKSYQDQRGVWTIGYGSTGPGIGPGLEWTQAQADQRFSEDLQKFISGVAASVLPVKLSDKQLAACTSFAYNVGLHNFQASGCCRLAKQERWQEAAANILLWNKIGSYVSPGLTARRQKEHDLFLEGSPQ